MKESYQTHYREIENNHPWFVARSELFLRLLPTSKNTSILDFGCGSGKFLKELKSLGYDNLDGVEVAPRWHCGIGKPRTSKNHAKDPEKEYDIILMMDVLEHIEDDLSCLNEMRRHLKTGGLIILSVPAYELLWSEHDDANMHYRRYNRKRLRGVLQSAEFKINYITHWNMILLPLIALSRLINKNTHAETRLGSNWVSRLILTILRFENRLLKLFNLPFGLSIIACGTNE